MDSFKDAARTNTGLLAAVERRALISLAERMPAWITSDHLTGLGLFSMLMVGVSYGVSRRTPLALWWVVVWLALNWFGDSLDGTVARVRRQPRPRYGFYVDHVFDSFGAIFVLGAEYRSRLNGLYMATFFAGGAIGSALGGLAFAHGGWALGSWLGFALPVVALLYFATERR